MPRDRQSGNQAETVRREPFFLLRESNYEALRRLSVTRCNRWAGLWDSLPGWMADLAWWG
jgi:hypothetical protein